MIHAYISLLSDLTVIDAVLPLLADCKDLTRRVAEKSDEISSCEEVIRGIEASHEVSNDIRGTVSAQARVATASSMLHSSRVSGGSRGGSSSGCDDGYNGDGLGGTGQDRRSIKRRTMEYDEEDDGDGAAHSLEVSNGRSKKRLAK